MKLFWAVNHQKQYHQRAPLRMIFTGFIWWQRTQGLTPARFLKSFCFFSLFGILLLSSSKHRSPCPAKKKSKIRGVKRMQNCLKKYFRIDYRSAQTFEDQAGHLRFYGSNSLWFGSSTDNVRSKSPLEVPLSKVKYITSYIWRVSANFNHWYCCKRTRDKKKNQTQGGYVYL